MTRFIDWVAYYRIWLLYLPVILIVNAVATIACLLTFGKIVVYGYNITSSVAGIVGGVALGMVSSRVFLKRVSIELTRKPFLWPRHWWCSTKEDIFDRMMEEDAVLNWCQKRGQPLIYWISPRTQKRYFGFRSADLMVECRMTV